MLALLVVDVKAISRHEFVRAKKEHRQVCAYNIWARARE